MSFVYFAFITYAFCFLAADARIFGGDVTAWNALDRGDADEEEWVWWKSLGFIRLRPPLLRVRFVREHLSCYFCMGVWAGPLTHVFLWHFYQLRAQQFLASHEGYCFWHPNTTLGWSLGLLGTFLLGSMCSYTIHIVLTSLEAD